MKSHVLASVVDFIYFGEVNVNKEDMEDFLAVSEELTLKGLGNKREIYIQEGLSNITRRTRRELKGRKRKVTSKEKR